MDHQAVETLLEGTSCVGVERNSPEEDHVLVAWRVEAACCADSQGVEDRSWDASQVALGDLVRQGEARVGVVAEAAAVAVAGLLVAEVGSGSGWRWMPPAERRRQHWKEEAGS